MCAWKDDLISMRKTYAQIIKTCKEYESIGEILNENFPQIENLIARNSEFFQDIPDINVSIQKLTNSYCSVAQNLAASNDRLTHIENTQRNIFLRVQDIDVRLDIKLEKMQKKPWYKRLWNT